MKYIYLLFVLGIFLQSCSSGNYVRTPRYRHGIANENSRKVIFNASINLTVKEPDTLNAQLTRLASKYKGYIVQLGTEESTIRVTSNHLEATLVELSTYGKIKSQIVTGKDVTEEYTDMDLRLSNMLKARERYLELLAKAEHVEAALKVEKELERLNVEIESLKGKLNKTSHLVEYSTIEIKITRKEKLGILGHVVVGLYKGVRWLFVRG